MARVASMSLVASRIASSTRRWATSSSPRCQAARAAVPSTSAARGSSETSGRVASSIAQSCRSGITRHSAASSSSTTMSTAASRTPCASAARKATRRLGSSRRRRASAAASSRSAELATEAPGQAHAVGHQSTGRGLLLLVGRQLLEREGSHGLEQEVAAPHRRLLPGHDGGVDQPGQMAGGIALDGERRAEVLGGVEAEPARELGQGPQQSLFGGGEQSVRPLDRRPQGSVAQLRRRPTGLEEVQGPAQSVPEVTHAEARGPAGGQLQRQR